MAVCRVWESPQTDESNSGGYGVRPAEKVVYEEADFRVMAKSFNLKPASNIAGIDAEEFYRLLSQPSPDPYWKTRLKGSVEELFFLTTLDKTPAFSVSISNLARQHKYPLENIGVYIQPIVQGTSCHCEFDLYYNPALDAAVESTKSFVGLAGEKIAAMDGFFSRPYSAWQDTAYRGAEGTRNMQRKIKKIFDPNAVLNPGKLCF
jgi:hypothetical protein